MTDPAPKRRSRPISEHALTTSYRFDADMARVLTEFQYDRDDIELQSAVTRRLPMAAIDPPTAGVATVFDPDASLVYILYDDNDHRMANPLESEIIAAIASALRGPPDDESRSAAEGRSPTTDQPGLSLGVVTPHNAQRGLLQASLPNAVTANTVEKYQGGQRDVIAVSATVTDPEFASKEERFILDPNRLLVAISRSKYLTILVASRSLLGLMPGNVEDLSHGPVWARLFGLVTEAGEAEPVWSGSLDAFTADPTPDRSCKLNIYGKCKE